ncbi:MAG TPA: branched-chain amino acid ABC transporter permease, partial [Actinomycetota bacterium]|nr:branched-chain amino acid ABC transporter permease [Actinomycetota bacterium]
GQGFFAKMSDSLPFLMIVIAVLVAPKALRVAGQGMSFVVRMRESTPSAPPRTRAIAAAIVVSLLALVPMMGSVSSTQYMATGLIHALIFLSLVVLTGYSGQISLGVTAFMGTSAFTAAHLASDLGMSMWLAMPLGALAAVPVGAVIGVLAARLQGLFLALLTLAFAFMAQSLFFENPAISGGEGGVVVARPPGFTGNSAFFYLVLASLIVFSVVALNLRSGRTGRVLAGMRDSETACRSLGISVTRYKVLIFSLSAFMAGFAGILLAMVQEQATTRTFIPFLSLIYMTLAVLGGIFHVGGAIASGILYGLFPKFAESFGFINRIQLILFGLGSTLALAQNPEGLFGELRRIGHLLRRLLARARRSEPLPVAGGQE